MTEHFCDSPFPQQENIQKDFFTLHAGTLQLFLEGALYLPPLLACIAWHVLVPGWMTLLTVFLLPRAACLAAEVQTAVIYHARHEAASFLWNIFSPIESSQSTSLIRFQIYWTSLVLYLQHLERRNHRSQHSGVKSSECPVTLDFLWGINVDFHLWTCWKSINKLVAKVFDSQTAWRLCLLKDYWQMRRLAHACRCGACCSYGFSMSGRPYKHWD